MEGLEKNKYTLSPNIKEFRRFIMEDDNSPNYFPLLKIHRSDNKLTPADENIRLPGMHGTATQCSPVCPKGTEVPGPAKDKILWPIGGCAYRMIKFRLRAWGTDMGDDPNIEFKIIDAYAAIITKNPHGKVKTEGLSGFKYCTRAINDLVLSKPGVNQKIEKITPDRSTFNMNEICPNDYRWGPLFINKEHYDLFNVYFPNICAIIPVQFRNVGYYQLNQTQKNTVRDQFFRDFSEKVTMEEDYVLVTNCPVD